MITDLESLKRAVDRFPDAVSARLKATARESADRVATHARRILLAKTNAQKTAASITVIEDAADKQFLVSCPGDPDDPANLPLWLERGTEKMTAKAFMRPSADEETPRYRRAMQAAAEKVADETFG